MSMINPPHTYSEWTKIIDIFISKTDDEEVLNAMKQGSIEWQSGVAERFARSLIDAVNARMNSATDKFQKEITRSAGQEREIVRALISLRREMKFLAEAVDIPAIPADDRGRYRQLVLDQADAIQRSLEDSAKNDRSGKMSSIIRNNKVNAF